MQVGTEGAGTTPPKTPPPGEETPPAKTAGEGNGNGSTGGSEPQFSEEQKAYVKKLRDESASYRTKAKDLESKFTGLSEKLSKMEKGIKTAVGLEEGDELSPEKMKSAMDQKDAYILQLESSLAMRDAAAEHGIPPEGVKYFGVLLQEAAEQLAEEEELTEEQVTTIVTEVKARFGKSASTSVDGKGGNAPPPSSGSGTVTVERFVKMSTTEKSHLYDKQPDLYKELFQQAKDKRLI